MVKNNEDRWHCPVTFKEFSNHTKIVAIKTTGNVFAYEAVHELNFKMKNYTDLMTGEPFSKQDVLVLYDPSSAESMAQRDVNSFQHLKQIREEVQQQQSKESSVRHNPTTSFIMKEIEKKSSESKRTLDDIIDTYRPKEYTEDVRRILDLSPLTQDVLPGATFTNQKASSSLTSSSVEAFTSNKSRLATADEIREAKWKLARKVRNAVFTLIVIKRLYFARWARGLLFSCRPAWAI